MSMLVATAQIIAQVELPVIRNFLKLEKKMEAFLAEQETYLQLSIEFL
jgi:hypothetical protein